MRRFHGVDARPDGCQWPYLEDGRPRAGCYEDEWPVGCTRLPASHGATTQPVGGPGRVAPGPRVSLQLLDRCHLFHGGADPPAGGELSAGGEPCCGVELFVGVDPCTGVDSCTGVEPCASGE